MTYSTDITNHLTSSTLSLCEQIYSVAPHPTLPLEEALLDPTWVEEVVTELGKALDKYFDDTDWKAHTNLHWWLYDITTA